MVSIIVPIYKVEAYLKRCVDSILEQTHKNLEIILVDDGSPDGCGKICDEYAKLDSRIKVVHKKNGGLSSARNAGIDVATGTYVSFIDSDDWIEKDFIEKLRALIIENEADMSACTFCRTNGDIAKRQQFTQKAEIITEDKYVCAFLETSYAGYACNKMFKCEIFEKNNIRFDESIFNGEDFPFVLEYLQYAGKIAFIKQDLYYYYFRETGIMQSIRLTERFVTLLRAREKALAFLEDKKESSYDLCKASYLDILCKIKFMAMADKEQHSEIYRLTHEKIKNNKKGLFRLKKVPVKNKIKLFLMIYFPKLVAKLYYKKIKVE